MVPLKESEIVPTLKAVYNKVKTTRPHFSEENLRALVEKKMLKDYGVTVTKDLYDKISELPRQLPKNISKKPLLIKRDMTQGKWCLDRLPVERKREYKQTIVGQRPHSIFTSTDVKKQKPKDCKYTENINMQRRNINDDVDQDKTLTNSDSEQLNKTVFDRLYEYRHKPTPNQVARVKHLREAHAVKALTNKPPPVKKSCYFHEPPQKRHRYSRDSLNGTLNSSVFERLYDERKQFNTKKLTDTQKREQYLRQQREKNRKGPTSWKCEDTSSIWKCCCGSSTSTESATSDYDGKQDSGWSESECGDHFEPRVLNFDDTIVDSKTDDVFNIDNELQKVHTVLDALTQNFKQHMSLCHIDERDLIE